MKIDFPEYACPYAQRLAAASPRFARQVRVTPAELRDRARAADGRYSADPFDELGSALKVKGLKQRFPDRVLVMTTERCFLSCRHCFRQGIFGRSSTVETAADLRRCVDYVKAHPRVRDVLLSGGDVLTLPDEKVFRFVRAFAALPQIDLVRVCTRALGANPARITPALVRGLSRSRKVWVNAQFNCADELTPAARRAAARLVEAGIPVGAQTVLLKGVNDSAAEMVRLFQALTAARIRPYYVFQCDPIAGIDRFRVPLAKARAIERACAERLGGLSLPRFVCDVPGAKRKMPIAEVEG